MFPVFDNLGRVIAFGARDLTGKCEERREGEPRYPKFINSPENVLYSKGKVLYGLHFAVRQIKERNQVLIAEGNPDVIACHQFNVSRTVAPCGTSFTEDQAEMLRERFPGLEMVLMFDGDNAGRNAAAKASEMFMARYNVRVCLLPEGKDPDDILIEGGAEALEGYVSKTQAASNFWISHKIGDPRRLASLEGIFGVVDEMRFAFNQFPQDYRNILVNLLAETLRRESRLDISLDLVKDRLSKKRVEQKIVVEEEPGYDLDREIVWQEDRASIKPVQQKPSESDYARRQEEFVRQLVSLNDPDSVLFYARKRNVLSYISDNEARAVFQYLTERAREKVQQGKLFTEGELIAKPEREEAVQGIMAAGYFGDEKLDERKIKRLLTPSEFALSSYPNTRTNGNKLLPREREIDYTFARIMLYKTFEVLFQEFNGGRLAIGDIERIYRETGKRERGDKKRYGKG